jgi:hypothetical protein
MRVSSWVAGENGSDVAVGIRVGDGEGIGVGCNVEVGMSIVVGVGVGNRYQLTGSRSTTARTKSRVKIINEIMTILGDGAN